MLIKKVERPRELKWFHAAAMLYGDWGTSKAYVLGIAFALSGHASWLFLGLMSLLILLVGFCYTIVCRMYPDGGGVYSSVKTRSRLLAVLGAFLLIADYVITASLSAVEAFHYFGFHQPELWAMGAILMIGAINWIGPTKGGTISILISVSASIAAGVLFISTLPHLPHVDLQWPEHNIPRNWSVFVGIVLALSGVEAIANMTGIMVKPVERTARRAIWPVMVEVSVLTFLLGIAMNAIPGLTGHTEDMLRALGTHYIGPWYGHLISVVFGFLLLAAVNTAITGLVSVQYLLAKDRELPALFSRLNHFGMPGFSLIVAAIIPVIVLLFESDVVGLAALYAIGVVGAITLNLGMCATTFGIRMPLWERILLGAATLILLFVEITICIQKPNALIFASTVLTVGLTLRFMAKRLLPVKETEAAGPSVNVLTVQEVKELTPLYSCSFLVALRTLNLQLLEEAVLRARALNENSVYLLVVEETPPNQGLPSEMIPSAASLTLLSEAEKELEKSGVTGVPLWQIGYQPGRAIARAARDLEVNTVLIGSTRRSALISFLRGDVLRTLTDTLPRGCRLLICG